MQFGNKNKSVVLTFCTKLFTNFEKNSAFWTMEKFIKNVSINVFSIDITIIIMFELVTNDICDKNDGYIIIFGRM